MLCLGHIVDENGKKMSKSLGNVIDPWEVLDTRGADALRWWMFSQGSPWTSTRAEPRSHRRLAARDVGHTLEHLQFLHDVRLA